MSELPPGWAFATLDELTDPNRPICYGILMPKDHVEDGVPYVKVKDFSQGPLDVASLRRTAPGIAEKYRRSSLVGGDVLISIRGTYGRVVIAPEALAGGNITQDTARVAVMPALERDYLAWFLQAPDAQRYFRQVARGVAVKGVNIGDLKQLSVPVAPRREQERIVAAIEEHLARLDAADTALRSSDRRMEVLQHRLVDSAIEGEVVDLGDLLREPLRNGLSARASVDGSIRVVTLTAVTRGAFVDGNTKLIEPGSRKVDDLWMQPGDIFIQRSNTPDLVGTAALFDGPTEWAIFPDLLIRVRVDLDRVDPSYLALVLRSTPLRRYFQRSAQGIAGSMPKISQPVVEAAPIPLPALKRQREILCKVDVEAEIAGRLGLDVRRAGRRVEPLRRSILAAAFSGQLVPQDPDDEPASVFLERIGVERVTAKPAKRSRKAKVS